MVALLLLLDIVFLLAGFGLRTLVQWRRTRDSGWRLGRPRSTAEGTARPALFASAALLGVALALPARTGSGAVGVALCVAAIAFVVVSQLNMGTSWRIGVDPDERTELVRSGVYRSIRNPIYSGMALFALGQAIAHPNAASIVATVLMAVGVQIQVRGVEEPYLRRTHGPAYTDWAATTGRFVPLLGRG